ncbi:MAG: 2-oxoacid:acceptor oxidoreductase family protein [Acidilobaceae archaeon]
MDAIYEIRWHGRGGQGAVTASIILAEAANTQGLYAQAFPEFGPERRGAPVKAYTRISSMKTTLNRSPIVNPDIVVVLDPSLSPETYIQGLKSDGYIIINTKKSAREVATQLNIPRVVSVDGTSIALRHLKVPIVNVAMLGALAKVLDVISLESLSKAVLKTLYGISWSGSLESLLKTSEFGEAMLANIRVLIESYELAEVMRL